MVARKFLCKVCCQPTTRTTNGVDCCNSCNAFIRRASANQDHPSRLPCRKGSMCDPLKCKSCRFRLCHRTGMDRGVINREMMQTLLSYVQDHKQKFHGKKPSKGFNNSLIQTINSDINKHFVDGPSVTHHEWSLTSQLSSIDYLKKLPFYKYLDPLDQYYFIRKNRYRHAFLSLAMVSYQCGWDEMKYPNEVDIFPDEILECKYISQDMFKRVRSTLVGKLAELKITEKELAVMAALNVCNPLLENLSEDGQSWIKASQETYSNLLQSHCTFMDPANGLQRFLELSSIGSAVTSALQDYEKVLCLHEYIKFETDCNFQFMNRENIFYLDFQ